MSDKTKIALCAFVVTLLSVICLWLIAFSNTTGPLVVVTGAAVLVVLVAVVTGAAVATGVVARVAAVAAVATGVAAVATGATGVAAGVAGVIISLLCWDKEKQKVFFTPSLLMWLVFTVPLVAGIVPLSKYHNQNQFVKDREVAELLEVRVNKDQIEIVLPHQHTKEWSGYLEDTLFVVVNGKVYSWKRAIRCQEGDKVWFKLVLPPTDIEEIEYRFDHAWEGLVVHVVNPLTHPSELTRLDQKSTKEVIAYDCVTPAVPCFV